MKKKLRIIGSLVAIALVAAPIVFLTVSCGGSDNGGGVAKNARFAAAWTTTNYLDSMYGVLMAADNGEVLFAKVDTDGNGDYGRVGHVVYQAPDGRKAVIFIGEDGLPMFLVDSDYVFQFLNYTETTVDIYRMGRDGAELSFPLQPDTTLKNRPAEIAGTIEAEAQTVPLNGDMQALVRAIDEGADEGVDDPEQEGFSFGTVVKAAEFALSAVGCSAAITAAAPTIAGGVAVAFACGSLLLDMLDEMGFDVKPAFMEDVGIAMSAAGCFGGKDWKDCTELFLAATKLDFKDAEALLDWFNQQTGRAVTPGLYTVGTRYQNYVCTDEGYDTTGRFFLRVFDGGFKCRSGQYVFTARYTGKWKARATCRLYNDCWWNEEDGTITDFHHETHTASMGVTFSPKSIKMDPFRITTCSSYGCYQRLAFTFSK